MRPVHRMPRRDGSSIGIRARRARSRSSPSTGRASSCRASARPCRSIAAPVCAGRGSGRAAPPPRARSSTPPPMAVPPRRRHPRPSSTRPPGPGRRGLATVPPNTAHRMRRGASRRTPVVGPMSLMTCGNCATSASSISSASPSVRPLSCALCNRSARARAASGISHSHLVGGAPEFRAPFIAARKAPSWSCAPRRTSAWTASNSSPRYAEPSTMSSSTRRRWLSASACRPSQRGCPGRDESGHDVTERSRVGAEDDTETRVAFPPVAEDEPVLRPRRQTSRRHTPADRPARPSRRADRRMSRLYAALPHVLSASASHIIACTYAHQSPAARAASTASCASARAVGASPATPAVMEPAASAWDSARRSSVPRATAIAALACAGASR